MGMTGSLFVGLVLLATMPGGSGGALQVLAPRGVVAEVDAVRSARAQDDHGVLMRDLAPGLHRLKIKRRGYEPQHSVVRITAGQVTVWSPQPWRRSRHRTDHDAAQRPPRPPLGALMIQTLPVHATIKAKSLGWDASEHDKRAGPVLVTAPAGRHRVSVCNDYVCVDADVQVNPETLASLFVDLDRGEVRDFSASHQALWRQRRTRCATTGRDCMKACAWDLAFAPASVGSATPWTASKSCQRLGFSARAQ